MLSRRRDGRRRTTIRRRDAAGVMPEYRYGAIIDRKKYVDG
jgi:hypothetical protein